MKEVKEHKPTYTNPVSTNVPSYPTWTHQHTVAQQGYGVPGPPGPMGPPGMDSFTAIGAIEGLDELCEMLGVREGTQGLLIQGQSGSRYSLIDILKAQMTLMTRLNILLVHRRLVPDE